MSTRRVTWFQFPPPRLRLAGLAALLLACRAVAAPVVRDVVVENRGPGPLDESFARAHIGVVKGAEIDSEAVARDIRALLGTGLFSDVKVYAAPLPEGVKLVYSFRNKFRMNGSLTVKGARHFSESKIRDWMALQPGDPVDDHIMGARSRTVVREYREDYYPKIEVDWEISETESDPGLADVRLTVDEGGRSRVKKVMFSGNETVSSRELSGVIRQKPWWNPLGWFSKRRYEADELEFTRLDIRDYYLGQGYLDARVDAPVVTPLKTGKVRVEYPVHEGRVYRFNQVTLGGVTEFPESSVRPRITCRQGQPVRRDTLQGTVSGVTDYYGERGYVDAEVRTTMTPHKEEGTVDVRFELVEGKPSDVRNIQVRGNTRTKDKVVRRELLVAPGDLYDTVKVRRSERRITNLGYFSSVRTYDEPTAEEDERDLIVEVEEKRTGQLMLGAGFSSIDKLIGYAELSQGNFDLLGWPNFTGGGQKLRLRAQFGSTRKRYELSFTEPWFLDRQLSLGFDLYLTDVDYTDYELKRTGAAVTLGRALPGPNRISFRYRIERIEIHDVADTNRYVFADDPTQDYYFNEERDALESSFGVTLSHDTRDNPFVPTKGNRVTLAPTLTGGFLGADTDVYDISLKSWHYVSPWFGHVLNLRTRFDVVESYGDTDEVPINNRLFLGGGRTLRGFSYRDVGPKVIREVATAGGGVATYDRPHGGQSLAMANIEYTVPLFSKVRLAAFYDIGNVWLDPYELDVHDLASSYGVGLRLDIPGFPIRVDRAWVLEKDDRFTDSDPWVVWIGYDL